MTSTRSARRGAGWRMMTATVLAISGGGCAHMNHAESGALMGTGVGALTGAAIGSASGNAGVGALLGGVTGAMAGGIIGDSHDARVERDLALMQRDSAVAQAQHLAHTQPRLTNFDLVRLSQSQVGDDVIISMIQSRGGQFDLSPDAVIAMRSSGVSDRVILVAQSQPRQPVATPAVAPGVVVLPPPAVIMEPPPIIVGGPWGPPYYRSPYRRPRSGASIHFGF